MAKRRGYKSRYTRDEVIAAAVEVIDAEPADAFTLRRLAEHLGVGVMTLYGYVASKDELLEGVATLLFDALGENDRPGAPWHDRLREQAIGIHDIVVRHPHLAPVLRAHAPNTSPFRARERMLAVLQEAGFGPTRALEVMGIVTGYAQGYASGQVRSVDGAALTNRVRELPADQFPLLRAAADAYPQMVSDRAFASGLDLLIAGLRAELER